MEDERLLCWARLGRFDVAHEEGVVSARELGVEAAAEPGDRAVELRRAVAVAEGNAVPERDRRHPAREVLSERLLPGGEDADRETARLAEQLV